MGRKTRRKGRVQKRLRDIETAGSKRLVVGNTFRLRGLDSHTLNIQAGFYEGTKNLEPDNGFVEAAVHVSSFRPLDGTAYDVEIKHTNEIDYERAGKGLDIKASPVGEDIPLEGLTGEALAEFQKPFRDFLHDIDELLDSYHTCALAIPEKTLRTFTAYVRGIANLANEDYNMLIVAAEAMARANGIDPSTVAGTLYERTHKLNKMVEEKPVRDAIESARRLDHSYVRGWEQAIAGLKEQAKARGISTEGEFEEWGAEVRFYIGALELSLKEKPETNDTSLEGIAKGLAAKLENLGDERKIDLRTKSISETPSIVQLYEERYHLLEDMLYHAYDAGSEHKIARIKAKLDALIEEVAITSKKSGNKRARASIAGIRLTDGEKQRFKAILASYNDVESKAQRAAELLKEYDAVAKERCKFEIPHQIGAQRDLAVGLLDSTHQMTSFEDMLRVYRQLKGYFTLITKTLKSSKAKTDRLARLREEIGRESLFALRDREEANIVYSIDYLRDRHQDYDIAKAELAGPSDLSFVLRAGSDSSIYQNAQLVKEEVLVNFKTLLDDGRIYSFRNKSGEFIGFAAVVYAKVEKAPFIHLIVIPYSPNGMDGALGALENALKCPEVNKMYLLGLKSAASVIEGRGFKQIKKPAHLDTEAHGNLSLYKKVFTEN